MLVTEEKMKFNRDCSLLSISSMLLIVCFAAVSVYSQSESVFDTSNNHYKEGMKYLEEGELEKGKAEFEKAIQLEKKFAPAYEGLGNYYLEKESLAQALENFKKSKKYDSNYAPAHIGIGKVYYLENNHKKARGFFNDATKKRKFYNSNEAFFYLGYCYVRDQKLKKAAEIFKKGLAWEPDDSKLTEAMENVSKIETALSGLPKQLHPIALSEAITRADAAALVVNRLGLEHVFEKDTLVQQAAFTPPSPLMGKPESIADYKMGKDITGDYWACSYIEKMLTLGLMENYPDEEFKPVEKLTRANFAVLIQNILVKAYDDPSLATRYLERESEFADIPSTHYAYNAAVLTVSRGILKPESDGRFGILNNVSGAEAILAVRKLREQFAK